MDGGDCAQLCFAPPESQNFSNCTWELYTNDVCDEGCNNIYCASYKYASEFTNLFSHGEYITDLLHCANPDIPQEVANISLFDQFNCLIHSPQSMYLTKGIKYQEKQCQDWWIGDGYCDDSCRVDECLNDLNDCNLGCQDDICLQVYQAWLYFAGTTTYNVNRTIACRDWWPVAVSFLGVNASINCNQLVINADFNQDEYINFREFIMIGVQFVDPQWEQKSTQINCSSCVGMEHYNQIYVPNQ